MDYRTPLSKVRGLGSAKSGTAHWWLQRVTAVVLIPLTVWLLWLFKLSFYAPYQETAVWLSAPLNSICLLAWIVAVFYHAALGVQVVIEDYVAGDGSKIIAIWLVKLIFGVLALAASIAVFKVISAG
ncbi:MAG: succinate dehydrogenase, hydrophobic membrane anchor protein [Gammaproteobacteria bacterium HGW-Gammaproteobacteria-3]|nr:MAG: succinate dehydrogenase, hydrophobic membrane anchor protein [Gammaproteobacteria bacterium HGW-Gammaproteobacteria-3]